MNEITSYVASPCTRNCCLNDDDICLGCFRSLDEIKHWTQAEETTRQQFINSAQDRREAYITRHMDSDQVRNWLQKCPKTMKLEKSFYPRNARKKSKCCLISKHLPLSSNAVIPADCRYPDYRDVSHTSHPWLLGSINPWRNDFRGRILRFCGRFLLLRKCCVDFNFHPLGDDLQFGNIWKFSCFLCFSWTNRVF